MKKIVRKITHTIVPHEKNGNIPHILKEEFFVAIAIFAGLLFYFNQYNFNIIRSLNLSATVYPAVLADLTNQDRLASNVSKLTWNTNLEKAAKLKAEDMLKNGYFAHTSPSGITPWHWLKEANYNFIYAGENLAVDFTESANVQKAWLNSPKHRENIMNSNFTEIGIATVDGYFEGKNTTFVVEFFGKPSFISETKVVEKITPEKNIIQENDSILVSPNVAGVKIENLEREEIKEELTIIEETEEFIVAKNEYEVEEEIVAEEKPLIVINNSKDEMISTWYERFVFSPTKIIKNIYITLLSLILVSMILLLLKERQHHHLKHLKLGIGLIFIILILLYTISTNSTKIFISYIMNVL